ncbi:7409_t:CDS:2 [Cetraspora pellucida]|uniref:7409_t:CDS:1 n=1 Tax=Cetraspora pellucida TaxID=1433469 RepID=A0ACA9KAU6_9GLOM|nr:7409_t:CDS:2 [Cetraspora pellucida]
MSIRAWDSVVHARRNQLLASKRTHGSELDELWASIEYEKSAQEKLNYEQIDNVSKYSYALTNAAVTNLSNIIQPMLPSKRSFESLESETTNLIQSTEQISSGTFNSQSERMRTPPPRFPNVNAPLHTPNKRQMYDEGVIRYLDAMGQSLKYNQIHFWEPSMWAKVESYLENALKKSGNDFKKAIMLEIEDNDASSFRLYYVFPTLSRKIGERKYIVQNLSSLFKFYETTFGNIIFDWIESHSLSAKLTKSPTSSGIVKFDAKGIRLFDDKEIWHMEVAGSPSSPIIDHVIGDTKKSLHSDILNLVALLLEHLDVPVKIATNIKVMMDDGSFLASELASAVIPFSFEGRSKYKAVLYLMADEFINQLSIMQELDLNINHSEGVTVRDVL